MSESAQSIDALSLAISGQSDVLEQLDFNQVRALCYREPDFDYTDLGNAKLQVELVENKVVWVDELGNFAFHDGRWQQDINGATIRLADLIKQYRKQELSAYRKLEKKLQSFDDEYNSRPVIKVLEARIKKLERHCEKVQSKNTIYAIRDLFKAQKGITVPLATFDSKAHYVGVKNGIVDLRNGNFITNKPEYLMMKSMAISFDKDASCPRFETFISEIMLNNKEMVAFTQRLVGQMILGITNKDKFVILIGSGLNGKSVLIDLLVQLLADYAEQTEADIFTDRRNNKEYFKAELVAKRLVSMNESSRGDKLDSAMIKSCVRSGKVVARSPHGKPFTYQPMFTPVLSTNFLLDIPQDPAVWERLLIVPFDYVVRNDKRDPKLKETLFKEEGAGILNWMIEGAQKFLNEGLNVPMSLIEKQETYRLKSDRIAQFITDSCVENVSIKESLTLKSEYNKIFEGYLVWCRQNLYQATPSDQFKEALRKKGYKLTSNSRGVLTVTGMSISDFTTSISLKLHDPNVEPIMEM